MDLQIEATRILDVILKSDKRFVVLQGGTRSSKSFSIMQWIMLQCLESQDPLLVTIVRKTFPSLKKSVYRDFIDMLQLYNLYDVNMHNKTDSIIKLGNSVIEFISLDQSQKVRGAKRDILWVNECNEVDYESFFQLQIRTTQRVILDYNPTELSGYWIDLVEKRKDQCTFDISTYRDNPFLEQSIVDEIERLKEVDFDYYQIYNMGIASRSVEAIYRYTTIKDIPTDDAQFIALGLDWGYSNDPTAIVEVWKKDNTLYINELLYQNGMTNQDIAEYLRSINVSKQIDIIADSSEPKSIEELRRYGFRILPTKKGPDSVRNGIDILKRYNIMATEDSLNIIKELQRYKWKKDPNGQMLSIPVDAFNHGLDALRYVALSALSNKSKGEYTITIGGSGKLNRLVNSEYQTILNRIR